MDKDIIFISGDLKQTEKFARQLIKRTLAAFESVINIVAVKIEYDNTLSLATFEYHCTILIKIENGAVICAEARDKDDNLAVYGALEKIVEQIPLQKIQAGSYYIED